MTVDNVTDRVHGLLLELIAQRGEGTTPAAVESAADRVRKSVEASKRMIEERRSITAASVGGDVTAQVTQRSLAITADELREQAQLVYTRAVEAGHHITLPRDVFLTVAQVFPHIEAQKVVDGAGRLVGYHEFAVNHITKAYGVYQITPAIAKTLSARYGIAPIKMHISAQLAHLLFLTNEHYGMLKRLGLLGANMEETVVNLYIMHLLGASKGRELLSARSHTAPIEVVGPDVVRANSGLFAATNTVAAFVTGIRRRLFSYVS